MLRSSITGIVDLCVRRAWWVIIVALVLALGAGDYAVRHFAIHTDVNDLISPHLPWAERALQYAKEFPQRDILVVIDAPTPENAEQAASKLAGALRARPELFRAVSQPGSGDFFERNGLLFLPTGELKRVTEGMSQADVLLETLASDPSLRGALDALALAVTGVQRGDIKLDDIARPANMAADTVQAAFAEHPTSFSWRILASGRSPKLGELRRFLQVEPVLNFGVLEPGRAASEAITRLAANLHLAGEYQAQVRQTGRIQINDDEFATIKQNAGLSAVVSLIAVAIILVLALRSWRIILAVALSLFVGLALSTALGLFLVGALNVISVAFFVLFVGLGIDFGIQFSVRYRAERHDHPDLHTALLSAAKKAGSPLALAAMATAVGFSSFLSNLSRSLRARGNRWRGNDHCVHRQHHPPAGVVGGLQAARRTAPDRICRLGASRSFSRATSHRSHRRHRSGCGPCIATVMVPAVALPLLLGVGVAFKIYYIMAWRTGRAGRVEPACFRLA